jgi:signal-transduction protein with cAMP-binding, CBS, and nucleotidyltransferase domain
MNELGDNAMFVERLLPAAHAKLVTIAEDAPLVDAARFLSTGTDLVIVCNPTGSLAGIITKTNVIKHVSAAGEHGCGIAASAAMTRDVVLCRPGDLLRDVWARMKERGLKNIPVVDQDSRPLGVLHARDILQVLLKESKDEESMLRDYVMGVGYAN